jgi:hypothetical protein
MQSQLPLILVFAAPLFAQPVPLAFPEATGPAAHITGGRGGELFVVTNTNANGPGSLADAVSQGGRIIVFGVSGIIDLTECKKDKAKGGSLRVTQPGITILGQTAPGEGICLKGGALMIETSNVIVRHLRSRRGFIRESDTGDSIEVKPVSIGEKTVAEGQTQEQFDKIARKKKERGKMAHEFAPLSDILLDHCSASWATDENLTCTHADRSTVQWCIAAEGLDYSNPKQTPPNHSEGSLWGSAAPNGTSHLHHTLYAHNRLRNPRTTGGPDQPPVLTLYNCVVYNWSEEATHTGSERVLMNWVNNLYKAGPNTPAEIAARGFTFHSDPDARIFPQGNVFSASPSLTQDNLQAIAFAQKLSKLSAEEQQRMISARPFGDLPIMQTADEALNAILDDAGATLPARDAVDLRILRSVRDGTGRIIEKETDLPASQRWPDYQSLPALADDDHDGLPDDWQKQFNVHDAMTITASGYANIEHFANNTDPTGQDRMIVNVSASVSRATDDQSGEWKFTRRGDLTKALTVKYALSNGTTAEAVIAAKASSARVPCPKGQKKTVITLVVDSAYAIGCPSRAMVIR